MGEEGREARSLSTGPQTPAAQQRRHQACLCAGQARCSQNVLEPAAGWPNLNTALDIPNKINLPLSCQVAKRNSQCNFHENLQVTSVFLGLKNK